MRNDNEGNEKAPSSEFDHMDDGDKYQFVFDKAKELCDKVSVELDKLEQATHDYQVVMSILGYAVSMLVQGQAVSVGADRNAEIQNFAGYLVHITSLFQENKPVAEA